MKKVLSLFFFYVALSVILVAQERTLNGLVSDEEGMSLPGVTVIIKGTTHGTTTDLDGKYSLSGIKPENTIIFSYVGFETQEIQVGYRSLIDILLKTSAQKLDELVVTALGVKRQKREIGYSTEKIDAEAVVRSSAPNVISAIVGRSAGVQVSQSDGVEGGSTRIITKLC